MRQISLCVVLIAFHWSAFGQYFGWARSVGGDSWDEAVTLELDNDGNAIFAGWYYEDLTAQTINGPVTLINSGEHDAIIGKYSPDGALLWLVNFSSSSSEYVNEVAIDPDNNILLTGLFRGTLDVDPGAGETFLTSVTSNASDAFVVKLSPEGEFIWGRNLGAPGNEIGYSIACDSQGNVFSLGAFVNPIDLDPGPGIFTVPAIGSFTNYLSKLDANGDFVWGGSFGGSIYNYPQHVYVDNDDNVLVASSFSGDGDLDPGPGEVMLSSPFTQDPCVCKFNNNCELMWVKQITGTGDQYIYGIAVDTNGDIVVAGYFTSAADFDPGKSEFIMTPTLMPFADIFIVKMNTDGEFIWAKQMGGNSQDRAYSVATDAANNIYTTGYFSLQDADFDPGSGEYWLDPSGADVYISVLDPDGNFMWAGDVGANDEEFGYAIEVDANGSVYVAGSFHNTPDFDMGTGVYNMTSEGQQEIFVMKYLNTPPAQVNELNGQEITVYPNPANEHVRVEGMSAGTDVQMIDSTGRMIWRSRSASNSMVISLIDIPSGIYLIEIEKGNDIVRKKVMVH